jgi:hypothetical protein
MPIRRQAILTPTQEVTLAKQLEPLWAKGLSALAIADELNFGHGEYERMKPYHIYFYREKFNEAEYVHLKEFEGRFPRRKKGIPKGKHRYIHRRESDEDEEVMEFEEFEDLLDEGLPKERADPEVKMKRALCILHYWSPLRRAELNERIRKDFRIKGDLLVISLYRKKKYYPQNAKPEPFKVPLNMPLMDEVVAYLKTFKPRSKEQVFKMKPHDVWLMMREVFDSYPHFWRFNWVTKAVENAEDARTILPALLADTAMDISTVTGYVLKSSKHAAQISRRELELINERRAAKR